MNTFAAILNEKRKPGKPIDNLPQSFKFMRSDIF